MLAEIRSCLLVLACLAVLPVTGCLSVYQDWKVERSIRQKANGLTAESSNSVADAFVSISSKRTITGAVEMDLTNTLRLATQYSRELQAKRDALYLNGLSALAARREFGFQYSGTIGYVVTRPEEGDAVPAGTGAFKASRVLPTGGRLTADLSANKDLRPDPTNVTPYTTSASVELAQPLLAGAGYDASHEKSIQSERDLLYGLRTFVLERQDFAISIMKNYYNLLIQQQVLQNERTHTEQAVFLRKRSEALFKIRRVPAVDVMRSQQQELSARNRLTQAEAEFEIAGKRFLIMIGISVDTPMALAGEIPALKPTSLDAVSCIRAALDRRLDLKTIYDQRDDARRRFGTARLALLPKLDAFAKASASGSSDSAGLDGLENTVSGGVTLELPFDKRAEIENLKKAELALEAANRAVEQTEDSIRVAIGESFSRLVALEKGVAIEEKNMELSTRRADYTLLRFKNGELSNRDVVEAQGELLNSKNAYIRALVDYEMQRLQLLRDIGCADVAPDGVMIELPLAVIPGTAAMEMP